MWQLVISPKENYLTRGEIIEQKEQIIAVSAKN